MSIKGVFSKHKFPWAVLIAALMTAHAAPRLLAAGDSLVTVSSGEEQEAPPPDLVVYNSHGPAIVWQRMFRSKRGLGAGQINGDPTYENQDFGIGWSHLYAISIYDQALIPDAAHSLVSLTDGDGHGDGHDQL